MFTHTSLGIQNLQLMMSVKNTVKIGCFSFPKENLLDLLSRGGTRQEKSNQNVTWPFLKKRSILITCCFLKVVVYLGESLRPKRQHHNYMYTSVNKVIHLRLDAAKWKVPEPAEAVRIAR
jgi:hypothetical protein